MTDELGHLIDGWKIIGPEPDATAQWSASHPGSAVVCFFKTEQQATEWVAEQLWRKSYMVAA